MYETILIHLRDEKLRRDLLEFPLSLKFINKVSCALLHVTYIITCNKLYQGGAN